MKKLILLNVALSIVLVACSAVGVLVAFSDSCCTCDECKCDPCTCDECKCDPCTCVECKCK